MSNLLPVVVAVEGSESETAAIRYGAHEARRAGRPLLLAHVVPQFMVAAFSPAALPMSSADLEAIGHEVLDQALSAAHRVLPESMVSTKLLVGPVVPALLQVAAEAALMVLGDGHATLVERVAIGSVVTAVAANADIGVVTVPSHWTEDDSESHQRRVLVGIKEYDAVPLDAVRTALGVARAQRAVLELLYVWDLPGAYGDAVTARLDYPGWQEMVDRHLQASLEEVRDEFPDVVVETSARIGQPARVLRERSAAVDLLLLTRRAHAFPFGHFGSTGRALLRGGACPVEVLPFVETAPSHQDGHHDAPRPVHATAH